MSRYRHNNQQFCSRSCSKIGHAPTRFPDPANWTEKVCEICGGSYKTSVRRFQSRFCSNRCRLVYFGNLAKSDGQRSQSRDRQIRKWKDGAFSEQAIGQMKIANLGKRGLHSTEGIRKLREARLGAKNPMFGIEPSLHPNWQGGKSFEEYPVTFSEELKERIRCRDRHKCRLCGKDSDYKGRRLQVHHIDYDKSHCEESNLVTLCTSCNFKVNRDRKYWQKFFTDLVLHPIKHGGVCARDQGQVSGGRIDHL